MTITMAIREKRQAITENALKTRSKEWTTLIVGHNRGGSMGGLGQRVFDVSGADG